MSKTYLINLGSVEDIPIGQGLCFIVIDPLSTNQNVKSLNSVDNGIERFNIGKEKVNKEEVAVFRLRDGRILAVENRCPHRRGPLSEGVIGDGKVVCPLHGHKFDLHTGVGSEHKECVRVFKTKIENEHIFLEYTLAAPIVGECIVQR